MGLFDIFKKKEEPKREEPKREEPKKEEIKNEKNMQQTIVLTSISSKQHVEFDGLNLPFLEQLYFVDDEQKEKLIKFGNFLIKKYKLEKINNIKAFENIKNKIWDDWNIDLIDEYPEPYKEYNTSLKFPYFDWFDFVKFKHGSSIVTKSHNNSQNESDVDWNNNDIKMTPKMAEFNLINKSIRGETDNLKEITSLQAIVNTPNQKHFVVLPAIQVLTSYYVKIKDYNKVEELVNKSFQLEEPIPDGEKEYRYYSTAFKFQEEGNEEMFLSYLRKAVDDVRKIDKTQIKKNTGVSFKHLAEALDKAGNKKEALEIAKEGLAFNNKLALKKLITTLEKI